MKDYTGNRIPFIYVLFHEADRDRVMPVIEAMQREDLRFCGLESQSRRPAKRLWRCWPSCRKPSSGSVRRISLK